MKITAKSIGFNDKALNSIQLLDKVLQLSIKDPQNTPLTEEERSDLQEVLVQAIGNTKLNALLVQHGGTAFLETNLENGGTRNWLTQFSHKTRNIRLTKDINFERLLFEIKNEGVSEENKMTLKQYGVLHDLASLADNSILADYSEGNAELKSIHEKAQIAAKIIHIFDEQFDKNFKIPPGSIVLNDSQKKAQVFNKEMTSFEKLATKLVNRFEHVAKVVYQTEQEEIKKENSGITVILQNKKDAQNILSHLHPTYMINKFKLREYLYSNVYRIKLESLISEKNRDLLEENYGAGWLDKITTLYHDIERQIHDGGMANQFSSFDASRNFLTNLKLSTFGNRLTNLGHKSFFNKNEFHHIKGIIDINQKPSGTQRMICSEFVARTTIAALEKLNDEIIKDLTADSSKKNNLSIKVSTRIIEQPIQAREDLSLMTPDRLLEVLKAKDAIEEVKPDTNLMQSFKI